MDYLLQILGQFNIHGSFKFDMNDNLKDMCNAPRDLSGVYLVYDDLTNELIYIGRSGKMDKLGTISIRKAGLGGIKDRIVNGHQFGKMPRRKSWPKQMKLDCISRLRIDWYITKDNSEKWYCPEVIENSLLNFYNESESRIPKWNKASLVNLKS